MDRIIGEYTGAEKGPLLIIFGGMHGNEPAGVRALELLFKMLEVEPITNPFFTFCGRVIGVRGNVQALEQKTRFLVKDLNRQWTKENIARVDQADVDDLDPEDYELRENIRLVRKQVEDYQPEHLVILDIHTTTAFGGIFSIPTDDPESLRIAVELHAPVVQGMLEGINGTTLHYFNAETMGVRTTPVVFESGQHDEPLSINRAIAAVINCMRTIGCVQAEHVENRHDQLLIEFSENLPKVNTLVAHHAINPGDEFEMEPNYQNFQMVRKGELLAKDKNGPIYAQEDGLILMPLYQKQGDDGFFIIRAINVDHLIA